MPTTFVPFPPALALLVSLALSPLMGWAGEAEAPVPNPPAHAAVPEPPAEWRKLETKYLALPLPRQIVSPGLYDSEIQKIVEFPKEGTGADLTLPHEGKNAAGKEYPPLMARIAQGFVWVDLNGDGKSSNDETRKIGPEGVTDPFSCELHYADGAASPYSFRFKLHVENQEYVLLRACARVFEIEGKKIVLLDDNGNGKYNDVDKDAMVVGDNPVSFIGKYISVGPRFYEILIHEAGTTVEVRPAPVKNFATSTVDLFEKFKPPQKSESLRIHTLIISGPEGSFAVDDKRRTIKVPVGSYDLVFGLFERAKEVVYLKKGEKTSFNVIADNTATLAWGGDVNAAFEIQSDVQPEPKPGAKVEDKKDDKKPEEKNIWVGVPTFHGEGTEQYVPENFRIVPVTASLARIFTDRMKLERKEPAGSRRYDVLPNGQLKPQTFKPFGNVSGEYEIAINYNSGIMGTVTTRQRYTYTYKKKAPEKKP